MQAPREPHAWGGSPYKQDVAAFLIGIAIGGALVFGAAPASSQAVPAGADTPPMDDRVGSGVQSSR